MATAARPATAGGTAKDAPMPATLERPPSEPPAAGAVETSMSDEAFGLINEFYDGVDHVIRELAERIAVNDGSRMPDDPGVVAIEVRHVREAGRQIAELCRASDLVGSSRAVTDLLDKANRPEPARRGWFG